MIPAIFARAKGHGKKVMSSDFSGGKQMIKAADAVVLIQIQTYVYVKLLFCTFKNWCDP